MISPITYEKIIKKLAEILDRYTKIPSERILNSDSIRGTNLSEYIDTDIVYSPSASDSFLLFELLEDMNGEHFVTKGKDDKGMLTIQTYKFHIYIYGNHSSTDAQRISAIFKTEEIVLDLRNAGIFIVSISPVEQIKEFVNDTLLLRRDLEITLETTHQFDDLNSNDEYFEQLTEIIVRSKSDV